MGNIEVLKRLYREYTKKYLSKILLALLFSLILAGSTSSIAYLLDPAIEKIFINKDKSLILIIPVFIVIAFAAKGISLYAAKVIMIGISEEIRKALQMDMMRSLIKADTKLIDEKHKKKICNIYSLTHSMCEDLLLKLNSKLKSHSLRLSNSYGMPVLKNINCWWLVLNDLCRSAKKNGKIIIKSDGTALRDFIALVTKSYFKALMEISSDIRMPLKPIFFLIIFLIIFLEKVETFLESIFL